MSMEQYKYHVSAEIIVYSVVIVNFRKHSRNSYSVNENKYFYLTQSTDILAQKKMIRSMVGVATFLFFLITDR